MRNLDPATLAALAQPDFRLAFLVDVQFPNPYRLSFTSLTRDYEFNGITFQGAGKLGSVSDAASSGDLTPGQYNIRLSGISDSILEAVSQLNYMNKTATCWAMTLDDNFQIIGTPFIWFRGLTDGAQMQFGGISAINIDVRSRATDWSRPRISRYTDEEQQRLYPGDKAFEFVSQIASREVEWPAESWFRNNQ